MITVARALVDEVRDATSAADLHASLERALRLEHATIPLYLTAYFSIKPGQNTEIADLIRSVVIEEMLHFAIVANLINALGGRPGIDTADMVPTYPASLGSLGGPQDLTVPLAPMSLPQCELFAQIEQPDDPVGRDAHPEVATIGEFYQAIIDSLPGLDADAFGHPSAPQVTSPFYPPDQLFEITDVASAGTALTIIRQQGEGTASNPFERGDELAHYYRFRQIVEGHTLVDDPAAAEHFSYTGTEISLTGVGIYPLIVDPKVTHYDGDAVAQRLLTQFDDCYRRLLAALQQTFTGKPAALGAAIGVMYELRLMAIAMAETPATGPNAPPGSRVTPLWRYPS